MIPKRTPSFASKLIVFAVGTLAHVLLTGVRRRRRDLALLKTLGFARSQVLGVVAWEASAFAVVALLIGLPLGYFVTGIVFQLAWSMSQKKKENAAGDGR